MATRPAIEAETNNRVLSRTIDFSAEISRWRRRAEEYRVLAEAAESDIARKSYGGLAVDYDNLAAQAEETFAATKA